MLLKKEKYMENNNEIIISVTIMFFKIQSTILLLSLFKWTTF